MLENLDLSTVPWALESLWGLGVVAVFVLFRGVFYLLDAATVVRNMHLNCHDPIVQPEKPKNEPEAGESHVP